MKINYKANIVISFLIIILIFQGQTIYGQGYFGKADCHITLQGVHRHFIVYDPSAGNGKQMPVVFMFHGTSGNGEKFYNISGWKEKADREGLIAVFPSALRYCIDDGKKVVNTTKWNDGKLDDYACEGQDHKDDVLFFREMVKYLAKNYNIDKSRIFASGFSNGGNFVSRLTLEASDILAATSIMAGYLQDTSFTVKRLIPSCLALGDLNLMKNTGKMPPWNERVIEIPQLRLRVMAMVDELYLEQSYKFTEEDSILSWQFDRSKVGADNIFILTFLKDLDHRYPNGKNYPMVMADIFWDFFRKYRKDE